MNKKLKLPKYGDGTQQVQVPQGGTGMDVASGAMSGMSMGASAGSAFGPWGTAIGAVAGAGIGLIQGNINKHDKDGQRRSALANNAYNTLATQNFGAIPHYQGDMYMAKNGLSSAKAKTPIEIEDDELVFKKTPAGRFQLKKVAEGKTHAQGGIPYVAEQGDIIFPGHKKEEILEAYKQGNMFKLESERLKLPTNPTKKKFGGGTQGVGGGEEYTVQSGDWISKLAKQRGVSEADILGMNPGIKNKNMIMPGQKLMLPSMGGMPAASGPMEQMVTPGLDSIKFPENDPYTPTAKTVDPVQMNGVGDSKPDTSYPFGKPTALGAVNGLLTELPNLYNLGRGLFDKPEVETTRTFKPEKFTYTDMSNPLRRQARQNEAKGLDMARNASAGNVNSYMANARQSFLTKYNQMADINNNEAGRREGVNQMNTHMMNDAQRFNIGQYDRTDEANMMNRARQRDFIAAGLSGASQGAQMRNRLNKQDTMDQYRWDAMNNMFKFQYGKDGINYNG